MVTASSTVGGRPHNIYGTFMPCLSSAWLQPSISAVPIRLNPGSASTYSYLPPETSRLQGVLGNQNQLQMSSSAVLYPSAHGWGAPCHLPGPFYGPPVSQYRGLASVSPMEQLYAPSHLHPGASLQLVQLQPSRQGQVQPASFQPLYNHVTLGPIPFGERNPVVQTDRAVPASPAPNSKVVLVLKELEPRTMVTPASASGCYAAAPKPSNAKTTEAGATGMHALCKEGIHLPKGISCCLLASPSRIVTKALQRDLSTLPCSFLEVLGMY